MAKARKIKATFLSNDTLQLMLELLSFPVVVRRDIDTVATCIMLDLEKGLENGSIKWASLVRLISDLEEKFPEASKTPVHYGITKDQLALRFYRCLYVAARIVYIENVMQYSNK